jgi:glycosyltransferase involved in cell wall biosynthesis
MASIDEPDISYSAGELLQRIRFRADVFIYMFSHNFLWPDVLEQLSARTQAPILFWMMDAAAVTGGCHFPWTCRKYAEGCGTCPGLPSERINDITRSNIMVKHQAFKNIRIHPICGTKTQERMVAESFLFKEKKYYSAPAPVDQRAFGTADSVDMRTKYGLPLDSTLIFFAAQNLGDERKGMGYLLEALKDFQGRCTKEEKENIRLVVAGNQIESIAHLLPFQYHYLGFLGHADFSNILGCVDIFACPSIEDAGPMVINQSLMAGTPVVAFNMGVAAEIVVTGITGYRAELMNAMDFGRGLSYLLHLDETKKKELKGNCRRLAIETFSVEKVSEDFYRIFNDVIRN